jgi:hypothetical protein
MEQVRPAPTNLFPRWPEMRHSSHRATVRPDDQKRPVYSRPHTPFETGRRSGRSADAPTSENIFYGRVSYFLLKLIR